MLAQFLTLDHFSEFRLSSNRDSFRFIETKTDKCETGSSDILSYYYKVDQFWVIVL